MAAASQTPQDQPPASPEYADPVDVTYDEPSPKPAANMPPLADPEGELEELEDRSAPVERMLWAMMPVRDATGNVIDNVRREKAYMQKGLSFFGKIELYGLLGSAVKVVLEGENPLGVGSIVDMAQNPRQMVSDLMGNLPGADDAPDRETSDEQQEIEAGKVLAAFAQVVSMAPQLIEQAYCVALAIPKTHRNWAIDWAFPNMDDEMGQDILHTFIDQNWGVMEDFFVRELPKIMRRIVKARKAGDSVGRR
jgi:hypothetical protein